MKMWSGLVWAKWFVRKDGVVYLQYSDGEIRSPITPDSLNQSAHFQQHGGKYYINVDAFKRVTGAQYI
jgi:hypothetical protein